MLKLKKEIVMPGAPRDHKCPDRDTLKKLIVEIILEGQAAFRRTRNIYDRESLSALEVYRRLELRLKVRYGKRVKVPREKVRLLIDEIGILEDFPIRLWIVQATSCPPALVRDARSIIEANPVISSRELHRQLQDLDRTLSHRSAYNLLMQLRGPIQPRKYRKRE